MTAQISDRFVLKKKEYSLAGISEGELFDPKVLGLNPVGASTACWRGYQAIFSILDSRLILQTLHVNLVKDRSPSDRVRIAGPVINGVTPADKKGEHFGMNNHYENINYHLEYSGGLLLADGFIRKLYVHMGFHPAWKYTTVIELIFESGRLRQEFDRSAQMAELRQMYQESSTDADDREQPSDQDITRFIERAFDRRYRL